MDPKFHGSLFQYYIELCPTENGENELMFCSKFYLEEPINEDSSVDLIVNSEIRPTYISFDGKNDVNRYNYSVYTFLPQNEEIKDCFLGIKNVDGSISGLYYILNNIKATDKSSPPIQTCTNCGTRDTPIWRRGYCNACSLYLKRNKINRQVGSNNKVLRNKRKKRNYICAECNATSTLAWRMVDGKTYCNKHGLSKKRNLRT